MTGGRVLAALPLFADTPLDLLDAVACRAHERSLAPGQTLLREGDPGDEVMIVLAGEATVAVGGTTVGTIAAGDCVGEMAVLERAPRSATVTSSTALRALVVEAADFGRLLDAAPALAQRLTQLLVGRLRRSQEGWAGLAGDPDVLLEALLELQDSPDPAVAEKARRQAAALVEAAAARSHAAEPDPLEPLSPAERRVAELLADGLSNQRIADELFVSRHTVDSHVKRAYAKLGLRSRVELAALVIRRR
jgi:CRP-like cAMP-binding protein